MATNDLTVVQGIGELTARRLAAAGVGDLAALVTAGPAVLTALPGFSPKRADAVMVAAKRLRDEAAAGAGAAAAASGAPEAPAPAVSISARTRPRGVVASVGTGGEDARPDTRTGATKKKKGAAEKDETSKHKAKKDKAKKDKAKEAREKKDKKKKGKRKKDKAKKGKKRAQA